MESKSFTTPQHTSFVILLILITITSRVEDNIYIQFFPEIIHYFNITEDLTNYILRANFAGSFLGGLIIGPIADVYSRKKVLVIGIALYAISSLGCFLSADFIFLLFWKFIEGIARAVPLVVIWIIFFDKFSSKKSGEIIGFIKGISTFIATLIPLLTYWISKKFNWHLDFFLIFVLTLIVLVLSITSIEEEPKTISKEDNKLNIPKMIKSYIALIKNFEFMAYTTISSLSSVIYILFFSNASIIFINHLQILNVEELTFYQTIGSWLFIIVSFASIYIVNKKGIDFINKAGLGIFVLGCVSMFVFGFTDPNNFHASFISMMIVIIGNGLMNGFMIKAVESAPEDKGTSMSLITTFKIIFSARAIFWSQTFFNNTIIPTTSISLICALICAILFIILQYRNKIKTNN